MGRAARLFPFLNMIEIIDMVMWLFLAFVIYGIAFYIIGKIFK